MQIDNILRKSFIYSIKNIIRPDVSQVKAHEILRRATWPSPSPLGENLPPTILNVPKEEIKDFLKLVVSRYIRTIKIEAFKSFNLISTNPKIQYMSNAEFINIFTKSVYSKFLTPKLDSEDLTLFFDQIDDEDDTLYFKIDFSPVSTMELLKGQFLEPTKTLIKFTGKKYSIEAIYLNKIIFSPQDKNWNAAKTFVLQAAQSNLLVGKHPLTHFPFDSINGITKYLMPENSLFYQLLEPHMYMQLPLNFAVLYIDKSVAHNNQNEPYTPFPFTKSGFVRCMENYYTGVKGNSSYPPFSYKMQPDSPKNSYSVFLEKYWITIYLFVKDICKEINRYDPLIIKWADSISAHVKGFPDGQEISINDNLECAITTYIHTVSVEHSSDHYSYSANHDSEKFPLRLRVSPPTAPNPESEFSFKGAITRTDIFRHNLATKMYFTTHAIKSLSNVQYNFNSEVLQQRAKKFRQDLILTEKNMPVENIIPLKKIATSMQF